MVDRFRKPRARRGAPAESTTSAEQLNERMRRAGTDPDEWDAIERDFIRHHVTRQSITIEIAARMFSAFRSRPELVPGMPPRQSAR